MAKINSELLTMTYGALVAHLIKDTKDIDKVNTKLEKMGYNMGLRMTDELLCMGFLCFFSFIEKN